MISSEVIVGIFFRFVNFGVLLFGLHYFYRNYIRTAMQSDIEADDKKVAILAQQKDAYFQQEQFILQEIENQQQIVTHLMSRLEQWRLAAERARQTQDEAQKVLEAALRKKAAGQSELIAQYMLERRALGQAINELEVSLADHFKREKRGSAYIASTIDQIEKDH